MDGEQAFDWNDVKNLEDAPTELYFDLEGQTIDALELTLEQLKNAVEHPMAWKWVLVGMHSTLHGCFGLVLQRTDGFQLRTKGQEKVIKKKWKEHRKRPDETSLAMIDTDTTPRADEFLGLFAKACDPTRVNYLGAVPLRPTKQQKESVERLNDHRNVLIHFTRTVFGISVQEILTIITHSSEIVDTLLTKTFYGQQDIPYGPINTIPGEGGGIRARQLIEELRIQIKKTRSHYGLLPSKNDNT